jgi:chromosome segregation ATPase
VTIRDEVLNELRNRTPLAEIREKFRSQSQMAEAIRIFLEESEGTIQQTQQEVDSVEAELSVMELKLQDEKSEREEVSKETGLLRQDKEKLDQEVKNASERLEQLKTDKVKFNAMGYTPKLVEKLKKMLDRSGPELLSQVETCEKANQLEKDVVTLAEDKKRLLKEIGDLNAKKNKIERTICCRMNEFDELKLKTKTYKEAVDVTISFLRDGYSKEDLLALKHGVDAIGILDDPALSLERLVRGLMQLKTLSKLDDSIEEKRTELESLEKNASDLRARAETLKQVLIKTIEDTKDAGLKAITETKEEINQEIENASGKFRIEANASLVNIDSYMKQLVAWFASQLENLSKLQRNAAQLEVLLGPECTLVEIIQLTQPADKKSLSTLINLLEKVQVWIETYIEDSSAMATQEIVGKENNLMLFRSYRVSALIELATMGLKRKLTEYNLAH